MAETEPSQSPKGNYSKGSTEKSKGQASNPKRYIVKKKRTKIQGLELEYNTNFKGNCSDLEGYILDLVSRASDKFSSMMKDLDSYIGAAYSDICQPAILNKTLAAFPNPDVPMIILDMVVESPKTDTENPTSKIITSTRPMSEIEE